MLYVWYFPSAIQFYDDLEGRVYYNHFEPFCQIVKEDEFNFSCHDPYVGECFTSLCFWLGQEGDVP